MKYYIEQRATNFNVIRASISFIMDNLYNISILFNNKIE